jgi:hypothetical protein
MAIFSKIAEQKIQEAMERGEFDHLEGAGRPLPPEDDRSIPPELRLAYKILKNANCLPPELETLKEIQRLEELLPKTGDENEKYQYVRQMNLLVTKFNLMRKTSFTLEKQQYYVERLSQKLVRPDKKKC